MEQLYRWVKASERPIIPTQNKRQHNILYKGSAHVIHFIDDKWYWDTELTPTAYPIHNDSWAAIEWLEPIEESEQNGLIEDAINAYFHQAHEQLGRKDTGDIERKNWEMVKNKCEQWFKKYPL